MTVTSFTLILVKFFFSAAEVRVSSASSC